MITHDIEVAMKRSLPPHAIQRLNDGLVSTYSHHGFLLSTITLIVFFAATRLLSDYLFPKLTYPEIFKRLSPSQNRRFVNHHVLISAKILMIVLALYPYLAIVTGHAQFNTPFIAGASTTMGDITIVATSIFIGMYLHELLYVSSDVQWVSVLHHVGAVIVASVMVARNVRWEVEKSTQAYTLLIMTYGIFDILAGLWPRPVMVSRIVWPGKHRMNMYLCVAAVVLTILGTIGETIVAFFLYGINMQDWSLSVKVATPFCHVVFMCAQGYSSWIMLSLARKHRRKLKELVGAQDIEMTEPEKENGSPAEHSVSQGPSMMLEGEFQRN
ncbi:hypothetical protein SVAN01_01671 [Stagonosporopsis vannaccii]|nr:hypothetical protein SVAN01_01671 [Stagonosporopsis vannaccii]